ncbi:Fur family transcriptional regulator [Dactylococcopsis salina]|uniref:Fe2+/Zn2+ uptake regulation protein n=1 Tax=Dactylococcopsis salina (strain PCC 8305) TaxID=13035 RepID=K9YQQ5_DACS8|nr:Fur family transcriptional regulator [Dactylococcopsis salina]AFZ49239.1 Fe2+/Zn2+ uptake regulation protein [Dactylococcopsis salina PCC 8305]
MTTQRNRSQKRILNLLYQLDAAVSAQQIYVELRQREQPLGLATVYRALEALKLEGAVQARTLPTGESLYESIEHDQHYLTCLNCGESFPVNHCPVHELEKELKTSHQFQVFYHSLEFFGLCKQCQIITSDS